MFFGMSINKNFSMQCILSMLSIEKYVRFSGTDLMGHHFMCF